MRKEQIFTGITSQGGLLPADFLAALSDPKSGIDGLDPLSYRLAPGERLGEQVNRSWNRLKGCWANFQRALAAKESSDPTTTETRERWLLPLFQELDFGRLAAVKPLEIDGRTYSVSHGWGPVPIHLVGSHVDLDRRTPGAVGAAKASPHSLVQQVLNASDDHLWGIISNGFIFRLLRDNLALTRQAFVEWDLQAIFDGDLYPEFFLLWVVCHQSRFEIPSGGQPEKCWLEKWRKQAKDTGLRALENLRPGVEQAIAALGAGLISHKCNQGLREKLSTGQLSTQDFYRQILRLIYRLLFLLVAEDRSLLHPPLPSEVDGKDALEKAIQARRRYDEFYSIGRLRFLTRRRAGTPHPDLWHVLQFVTGKLGADAGCPELALPALGSFLWNAESTPALNQCLVSNRHFLEAVHSLAYIRDGDVRRIIDYKNLGSEELGSVYESLLELHPTVNADIGTFELQTAAGHERKTSGSYYTPDSLVQCLLDSALEPVIDEAVKGKEGPAAAEALLKLKICDPAVGSGHFLIAASHRLAKRIAAARTGEEEPSPEATRTALRDVIGRCLYGVDINPMAAELCRFNLWVEALEPGKPLSFLDHHIRVGNSLLGTTPELITTGLPDEAFSAIEGDDKEICKAWKRRNKEERDQKLRRLFDAPGSEVSSLIAGLAQEAKTVDQLPDAELADIEKKRRKYESLLASPAYGQQKLLADAWYAAFVWRKTKQFPYGVTTGVLRDLAARPDSTQPWMREEIVNLAGQYQFFHWQLAFPEVFGKGGFDCVLGNPPWERVKLQEKEWFAERSPEIANAPNAATRKRLIAQLIKDDPVLHQSFLEDCRRAEGESLLLRHSGRYPLCGRGDINLYTVFAEGLRNLLNEEGRAGSVLPSGIATDDTTKFFFQDVIDKQSLVSLFDFENRLGLFPAVDSRMKFCLFTVGRGLQPTSHNAEFAFFAHTVEDLQDPDRRFTLSAEDIALLNPNTRTCPVFRSRKDAELAKSIQRRIPVFISEHSDDGGRVIGTDAPWKAEITRTFDMARFGEKALTAAALELEGFVYGSGRFIGSENWIPILESKTFWHFDHRAATYDSIAEGEAMKGNCRELLPEEKKSPFNVVKGRYYLPAPIVAHYTQFHERDYWIAYRNITNTTNERTFVGTIIPRHASDYTTRLIFGGSATGTLAGCLISNLNSFIFDYISRQSLAGTNFSDYVMKQLPVLTPEKYSQLSGWNYIGQTPLDWLLSHFLELLYTAWDLEPFAQDCGWTGPPFRWDEKRRFLLRCELDAAFFHFCLPAETNGEWKLARKTDGCPCDETPEQIAELKKHFPTPRDAVAYIMDTFPIVRRKDEEKYDSDFRTKRVILEIYDAMQDSIRNGRPYQTRLDPPPADPCCQHPKLKIGILAYGSLINEPGPEITPRIRMRLSTTTPFSVEYGRYSQKRGGAPTVVPHVKGAPVPAEILVLEEGVTFEQARDMLWRRERHREATEERYTEGSTSTSVLVRELSDHPCVERLLYTDFNPIGKIPDPDPVELAQKAIESVNLAMQGLDGITYLQNNLSFGILTKLTPLYRDAILSKTNTGSLNEALQKIKSISKQGE